MNIDLYFFKQIHRSFGKYKWMDYSAVFFADYLPYLLVLYLIFIAVVEQKFSVFVIPLSAGLFSRFFINETIYFFYKRKRPSEILNVKLLIKKPNHPAFPSGHSSFFFALAFSLMPISYGLGILYLFCGFLVGFFRIFSGVHWPSDILGGIAVGYVSSFVIHQLFPWILSNL